jgi:hypothetical protein
MKDGYMDILKQLNVEEEAFIETGLKNIIDSSIKRDKAKKEWMWLVNRVETGEDKVYVRNYGRGSNSKEWVKFLKTIFPNSDLHVDQTNNDHPKRLISLLTDFSTKEYKSERNSHKELLLNYRVSHVFGKTKNPLAFTAPWNIVYLPTMFDPLTGHESSGDLSAKFSKHLKKRIYCIFKDEINHFNKLMEDINIQKHVELNRGILPQEMLEDLFNQFSPIDEKEFKE